jgi:hypothetical protein
MIHSFTCKNFYSFLEENSVSFVVNDNAPDNDSYFYTHAKEKLSKVETVIGPNASGKTNLLKVIPLLKWLIVDSFNFNPSASLPVKTFISSKYMDKPVELSVVFEIEGSLYTYSFKLNEQKIVYEELFITNKTKKKVTTKTLFLRKWDEHSEQYSFSGDKFDLPKNFENLLRKNASVVGTAMRLNHQVSQKIGQYWQKIETNVVEAGWIGDQLLPNAAQSLFEALNFYSENKVLKDEAEKLLKRFDLGLESLEINKEKKEDGFNIKVEAIHIFDKTKYNLPFVYESAGTKQLLFLLKTILQVLANGGFAVLDEFDVNLHPDMVIALYELFVSKDTNPKNAQMLFSSHSHRILSELDKYQIILTEKGDNGASETWRLDEMDGVRSDDNYYAKYIAGAYGAIPKIN